MDLTKHTSIYLSSHGYELMPALRIDPDVASHHRILHVVPFQGVIVSVTLKHLNNKTNINGLHRCSRESSNNLSSHYLTRERMRERKREHGMKERERERESMR